MNIPVLKKLVAVVALAAVTSMAAAAASLSVGAKAPPLTAKTWIKGNPVKEFEPGKVYLVEFWATWCPPCIKAIPHLTRLQKKYPDQLVVVGVAGSERIPTSGPDNRLDVVKKFVSGQGSKMAYRVVFDPSDRSREAWMKAAGKTGIPCTFVVDHTGKIAWIGHPSQVDAPLDAIIRKAPPPKKDDEKEKGGDDGAKDGNSDKGAGNKDGSKGGGTSGGGDKRGSEGGGKKGDGSDDSGGQRKG